MTQYKNKGSKVPNLRFPEFSEEQKRHIISDVLDFYSTNSLSWEQLKYENKGLKNIHYGLIHNGLTVNMDIRDSRLPVVKDLNSIKSYTLCQNGDVVFADASEDTYDVAKAIEIINCRDDKVICGLHTIHGRDKMNITALGFKGHYFSSPSFHKRIQRIAQGTKVFSVSIKNQIGRAHV